MAAPRLFISYRRDDSAGHAGRLFDRLAERFGPKQVFRDIDTLAAGQDFVRAVRDSINQCDVLLVLIGTRWLSATDGEGRWRLADDNDLVRLEIASALARNLRVIPVLLQGAAMPKAKDLPAEMAALVQRNAVEIRDTSFERDVDHLAGLLGPGWWHRLQRLLRSARACRPRWSTAVAVLAGLWAYPLITLTPEKARVQIVRDGHDLRCRQLSSPCAGKGDLTAVQLFLRAGMAPDSVDRRANHCVAAGRRCRPSACSASPAR